MIRSKYWTQFGEAKRKGREERAEHVRPAPFYPILTARAPQRLVFFLRVFTSPCAFPYHMDPLRSGFPIDTSGVFLRRLEASCCFPVHGFCCGSLRWRDELAAIWSQ